MTRATPRRVLAGAALALALAAVGGEGPAWGAPPPPKPPPPPEPPTVVEVPADELDALLRLQGKGVLLRYEEYRALVEAARARTAADRSAPPEDAVRLSAQGTLDLTEDRAARFEIAYLVEGLAPGPRSLPFAASGVAFEAVRVEPQEGAGPARYEELQGEGRLRLEGPGVRKVTVVGSAVPARTGAGRRLEISLPSPAAMSLAVTLPPGVRATLAGEGPAFTAESPVDQPLVVAARPSRSGGLVVAWAPWARAAEGESVLDADVTTLYTLSAASVGVRARVRAQVLRTAADRIVLEVPADFAVHSVDGPGVTGSERSEDRTRLVVRLEKPRQGPVEVLVEGARALGGAASADMPRVRVSDAVRHRGEVALRFEPDVAPRGVRVEGGRRVPVPAPPPRPPADASDPAWAGVLRYALARSDATVVVDLEPVALRVDATSSYYLNLAEPGQTLIATVAYRVVEGTLFRLRPRFPAGFDLRALTVNGGTDFARDATADGVVEIALAKGVPPGGEALLVATLERAKADWLPERDRVRVDFVAPSAGASREDGYLAVGADLGFEVLDAGARDLVAVGAADLTARGLSAAGLVYGYRLDGPAPSVALDVVRREPLVEAEVVTLLHPGPRRADFAAQAVYRIQRAGVRRLFLDLPAWAGDQVEIRSPSLRSASRLAGDLRPADTPEGYERWQVDLDQRAIGTHLVTATWFRDLDADEWTIDAGVRAAARAPLGRSERLLVVRRAAGLEVVLPSLAATPDVRVLDLAELPPEASADPSAVLEVLRLPAGRDGVEVAVRKHAGAAVLNAIATEVSLKTAVAREGILRTRGDLALLNVDRQFVEVVLPGKSTLVGAVVDGQPVKPLVSPRGVLLVTVPSTVRAGKSSDGRTHVVLTWETRLEGPVGGTVRVEGPVFPGLEVLHTTHEVGVEPDLRIEAVTGDLVPSGRVEAPGRAPWIAALGRLGGGGVGFALRKEVQTDAAAPASGPVPSPKPAAGRPARSQGRAHGAEADRSRESGAAPAPSETAPQPTLEPADPGLVPPMAVPTPVPMPQGMPSGDSNETDNDLPPSQDPSGGGETGRPSDALAAAGKRPGGPDGRRGAAGTKALLSLDVPVFLAPHRVVAARVGGGGAVEVEVAPLGASDRAWRILGLLALGAGLAAVALAWLPGWLTVVAGLLAALVLHLCFGRGASTLVAAVADASTLLAGLLAARWAVRRLARLRLRRASTAAVVLLAWAGLAAPASRAEDAPEPAPEAAPADEEAAPPAAPPATSSGTVFVPKEPARGAGLAPDDRVFVPLAAWLDLQRRAHPDRDPELAALGQVATLVEASYRVEVRGSNAEGSARLVLAQRGLGTLLVAVPLPGLAVTEAVLDGEPVRLLIDGAAYRVALSREGDHVLDLKFQVPVAPGPEGRTFALGAPTSVVSILDVTAPGFDGDLEVSGAGRVVPTGPLEDGTFAARAWLGRPAGAGASQVVAVTLAERRAEARPAAVRTRAESRVVHSLRDGGTESVLDASVFVLQGKARFVDLDLPDGVLVLEASGPEVVRWETSAGRLRLVLRGPTEGRVALLVRAFRPAASPAREEVLPEFAVRDTTGESGVVVVNGDPSLRLETAPGSGLFRTARPTEADAAGPDGRGRVAGAWRFAARPAGLVVRTGRGAPRVEVASRVRATFGDDRVRTLIEGQVRVQRAPVGELVFALPGPDEVRSVECPGLQAWWTDGSGDARRLVVRTLDLFEGDRAVAVRLERRLAGLREGVAVPRWSLEGAAADRGVLVLFGLPDAEPAPASAPGWKSLPPSRLEGEASEVPGARATHAYEWDAPPAGALLAALRTPEQEIEAVVVTQASPSDEEQRLEHLVVFDVRRGAADRLTLFVPDGGLSANDLVRARDLRELRSERTTRADADGKEVPGLLYTVRLQSAKSGLVEVTVSQLWPSGATVRVVRPEGVKATRWFGLVRTFLDGEVDARVGAGAPDAAVWADLPFLPSGLDEGSVLRAYAARAPYTLEIAARRHRLEAQADAVVLAAHAEAVVGLDGEARVRVRYRLFNRARQFLRLRLPEGAVLYGVVAAGRPVKPLAGPEGRVLVPVPKVPLGGTGYEVTVAYRAPAGTVLREGGKGSLALPEVEGVEVDRTSVALRLPEGLDYGFDTKMTAAAEREVLGDQVEATLREAQEVLKVAQTGTLEQRLFACDNGAALVADARARLDAYARTGASLDRLRGLSSEWERLSRAQAEAQTRCGADTGSARAQAVFEANNALGSSNANGQVLVLLDDEKSGAEQAGMAGEASGANWRFNRAPAAKEESGKKDLAELKGRLAEQLAKRDKEDRSKSVEATEEAHGRAGRAAGQEKYRSEADDQTRNYDLGRNSEVLNDELRRVQTAQRQLGAVPQAAPQTVVPEGSPLFGTEGRLEFEDAGGVIQRRSRSRASGFRLIAGDGADGGELVLRSGLMGVDVPLPRDGRPFWFVGVRAGSPVVFEASVPGVAGWLRGLLCVVLLGALAVAVARLRALAARRAARRAAFLG